MRLLLFIILVGLNFTAGNLFSQVLSNPISPASQPNPSYLGVTIGFGQNFQSGKMFVDCPGCVFEEGNKFGFTFGIYYEKSIFVEGYLGIDLLYNTSGLKSSYIENEIVEVKSQEIDFRENVILPFRHTADLDVSTLSFSPYFKILPFDFMFFKLGFGYNLALSSNLKHDKELLKKEVILSNGTVTKVKLADTKGYTATVQDGEYTELEKSFFTINPSIGFNIPFDEQKNIIFSPWFMYSIPLSAMSKNGEDFKINGWRILFSLGFKL